MESDATIRELRSRFGEATFSEQETRDGVPTYWVPEPIVQQVLVHLKLEATVRFPVLFDLWGADERLRRTAPRGQPACDFSLGYQLLSVDENRDIRLKVPLHGERP